LHEAASLAETSFVRSEAALASSETATETLRRRQSAAAEQ
jgi:hypothetical protein